MIRAGRAVWSFRRRSTLVGGSDRKVGPSPKRGPKRSRRKGEQSPTINDAMRAELNSTRVESLICSSSAERRVRGGKSGGRCGDGRTCTLGVISGRCVVYTRAGSPSQKSPPSEKANLHEMDRYIASCKETIVPPTPSPPPLLSHLLSRRREGGSESRGLNRMQRMCMGVWIVDGWCTMRGVGAAQLLHELAAMVRGAVCVGRRVLG